MKQHLLLPDTLFTDSRSRFVVRPGATETALDPDQRLCLSACSLVSTSEARRTRVHDALAAAPTVYFADTKAQDTETTLRIRRAAFRNGWPRPLASILIESLIELAAQSAQSRQRGRIAHVRPVCAIAAACIRWQRAEGYEVFADYAASPASMKLALEALGRYEGFDLSKSLTDNLVDHAMRATRAVHAAQVEAEYQRDAALLQAIQSHLDAVTPGWRGSGQVKAQDLDHAELVYRQLLTSAAKNMSFTREGRVDMARLRFRNECDFARRAPWKCAIARYLAAHTSYHFLRARVGVSNLFGALLDAYSARVPCADTDRWYRLCHCDDDLERQRLKRAHEARFADYDLAFDVAPSVLTQQSCVRWPKSWVRLLAGIGIDPDHHWRALEESGLSNRDKKRKYQAWVRAALDGGTYHFEGEDEGEADPGR
jgi:hypothetical protein